MFRAVLHHHGFRIVAGLGADAAETPAERLHALGQDEIAGFALLVVEIDHLAVHHLLLVVTLGEHHVGPQLLLEEREHRLVVLHLDDRIGDTALHLHVGTPARNDREVRFAAVEDFVEGRIDPAAQLHGDGVVAGQQPDRTRHLADRRIAADKFPGTVLARARVLVDANGAFSPRIGVISAGTRRPGHAERETDGPLAFGGRVGLLRARPRKEERTEKHQCV